MPTLTPYDLNVIALEGRFQEVKAAILARKVSDPTSEMASTNVIADQLKRVIDEAYAIRATDIELRARALLSVLEAIRLRTDMKALKAEFATAAAVTEALGHATKIAKDGAKNIVVLGLDKGLAKLFEALGVLKKGLDALSKLGVENESLEKARSDLEKALKEAEAAAKKEDAKTKEKPKGKTG